MTLCKVSNWYNCGIDNIGWYRNFGDIRVWHPGFNEAYRRMDSDIITFYQKGGIPDLLTGVTSSTGGNVAISYKASTKCKFRVAVRGARVDKVTTNDGITLVDGGVHTGNVSYTYRGGSLITRTVVLDLLRAMLLRQ